VEVPPVEVLTRRIVNPVELTVGIEIVTLAAEPPAPVSPATKSAELDEFGTTLKLVKAATVPLSPVSAAFK